MSIFDPNTFAQMTFNQTNSTEQVPVPTGEYLAIIKSKEIKSWAKRDDPSVSGLKMSVLWTVEDEAVKQEMDRDEVVVRQELMFDLTEEGGLDFGKGKNVQLGRLRAATDTNVEGQPFSFDMLVGRQARIVVSHRTDDKGNIYAEVKAVAHL